MSQIKSIQTLTEGGQMSSSNPYRQRRDMSAPPLTRSLSEDTEMSMCGPRKNAPVRAVFTDLHMAHSSINSGTTAIGRIKVTKTPSNMSDTLDDESSILLHNLDPATRQIQPLDYLPLPPPPAMFSKVRHHEQPADYHKDDVVSDQWAKPTQLKPGAQSESMFSSIKNAFATLSSPIGGNEKSIVLTPTQWLRNNSDIDEKDDHTCPGGSLSRKDTNNSQITSYAPQVIAGAGDLGDRRLLQLSNRYSGELSSIYHSSLGEAPSGSLPPSSREGDNKEHMSHLETHHDVSQKKGFSSYNEAVRYQDFEITPISHSRSREQSLPVPGQLSKFRTQSNDGSTVCNIYKHYVGPHSDDGQTEFDLQSQSSSFRADDKLQPSALNIRKQRRAERLEPNLHGQAPKLTLPDTPDLAAQRVVPSSSQGLGHSSSYGDTYNLLQVTEPAHWTGLRPALSRSNAKNDLHSKHVFADLGESSTSTLPSFSSNNPFQRTHGPQVVISRPADGEAVYHNSPDYNFATAEREPLEREVSNALRRISALSTYSDGSISSSALNYPDYHGDLPSSSSIGNLRRQNIEELSVSDLGSFRSKVGSGGDQVQAFYNQGAIAPDWIDANQNNAIRVPITHGGAVPKPLPPSPRPQNAFSAVQHSRRPSELEDDANDWETVGESGYGGDYKSSNETGILGGTINRAGSSIANTSDDGSASTNVPEIDRYGSTERFIQHPGNIQYHGDYRLRDLKQTNTPVFLPEFREHKVNGYLADSNRTRPAATFFNYSPRPLEASHVNPFRSPPPEVMSMRDAGPSYSRRNHVQNARSFSTTDTGVTDDSMRDRPISRCANKISVAPEPHNWMDDFGDPGPALHTPKVEQSNPHDPSPLDRPFSGSSYDFVKTFARGGTVPGYNPDGTRIVGTNPSRCQRDEDTYRDGIASSNITGLAKGLSNPRDYTPLVQGPPGAFYKELRPVQPVQSNGSERSSKIQVRRNKLKEGYPTKGSKAAYPTNIMRPISLLESQRVSAPTGRLGHEINQNVQPTGFNYRSPLAPPKRKSSQWLYRKSQLIGFKEAAKKDGYEMTIISSGDISTQSGEDSRARNQVFETPRLFKWPREGNLRTDLCQQRKKLSIFVLCLCNLFPLLLCLYATGRLDGLVASFTGGEITKFGRAQKRWAYIMMTCWAVATFFGLVAFLVYWFGVRTH